MTRVFLTMGEFSKGHLGGKQEANEGMKCVGLGVGDGRGVSHRVCSRHMVAESEDVIYVAGKSSTSDERSPFLSNTVIDDAQLHLPRDMAGKHRDPVWELKWVERERVVGDEQSKNETLVTVSTDGRVTQWMVRKGLEFNGEF